MATIRFGKMQAARRLEAEGKFTREQAKTLAAVYHDAMTEAVATKPTLKFSNQSSRRVLPMPAHRPSWL